VHFKFQNLSFQSYVYNSHRSIKKNKHLKYFSVLCGPLPYCAVFRLTRCYVVEYQRLYFILRLASDVTYQYNLCVDNGYDNKIA